MAKENGGQYSIVVTFNNPGMGYRRWRVTWERQIAYCCGNWIVMADQNRLPFMNEEGCPVPDIQTCPRCETKFTPTFTEDLFMVHAPEWKGSKWKR